MWQRSGFFDRKEQTPALSRQLPSGGFEWTCGSLENDADVEANMHDESKRCGRIGLKATSIRVVHSTPSVMFQGLAVVTQHLGHRLVHNHPARAP